METINILPRQLYRIYYPDKSDFEKIKNNIINEEYEFIHLNSKTVDKFLHRNKKYDSIFTWIQKCLDEIKNKHGYSCESLKITQSWANKTSYGEEHHPHHHPNSVLSGIFYITEGEPTSFAFRNPWYVGHPYDEDKTYVHLSYDEDYMLRCDIPADPGSLIIFPSNFCHRVYHNESMHDRYTLSFNSFPSGIWGRPEELAGVSSNVL